MNMVGMSPLAAAVMITASKAGTNSFLLLHAAVEELQPGETHREPVRSRRHANLARAAVRRVATKRGQRVSCRREKGYLLITMLQTSGKETDGRNNQDF